MPYVILLVFLGISVLAYFVGAFWPVVARRRVIWPCWLIGHNWRVKKPEQHIVDACIKQGGFAILFLPWMGTPTCVRCGIEAGNGK